MTKSSKKNRLKGQKSSKKSADGKKKRTSTKASVAQRESSSPTKKSRYRDALSPGSVSSKGTVSTASSSSTMSYVLKTPDPSPTQREVPSSSKRVARNLDLSVLAIDGSSKKKAKNSGTGRTKASTTKSAKTAKTAKTPEAAESVCKNVINMCDNDGDDLHNTSSSSESEGDESGDEDEPKELEAHQFEWHTQKGLVEGLAFHYEEDAYTNKTTGQQIDLLVKKYTPTQLKPVLMSLCFSLTRDPKDLNLNAITTKKKAGDLLKQLIVPALDAHESDVHSGDDDKW